MTTPPSLAQLAADFAARARAAGHPVLAVAPGRWQGIGHYAPGRSLALAEPAPNDLLDTVHDVARSRIDWIYAVTPTAADAVRLAAAVQPRTTRPAAPARTAVPSQRSRGRAPWLDLLHRAPGTGHGGDPRAVPLERRVAEVPLTAITLTEHHDGRAVHVVEIPAAWLTHPLTEVTR